MDIRFLLLGALLVLGGCASSSKTYTADGREGYSLNCSGTARNWGACLEKAGDLCGTRGYDVLERSGDEGAVVSANQYGAYGSTTRTRTMLIACKK
jgi:hypothetical protein